MSAVVVVAIVIVVVVVSPAWRSTRCCAGGAPRPSTPPTASSAAASWCGSWTPQAVGFGSEPDEAGGLRGQGVLAVSDTALVFVTWAPRKVHRIDRTAITGVGTQAPDARALEKATVEVTWTHPTEGPATASWRVAEIARWLDALGYDWGPEGPPALDGPG